MKIPILDNHKYLAVLGLIIVLLVTASCTSKPVMTTSLPTTPAPASTTNAPASTTNTPASTTTAPATTTSKSVTIDLVAQGMSFDKSTITVPAGASVTINFNNKDSIPHNFALYTNSSAATAIFVGQVISSSSVTYKFTAPATPGSYFFRCDVHPTTMTGTFLVQ